MIVFDLTGCAPKKTENEEQFNTLLPFVFGTYTYNLYFVIFSVFL